MAFHATTGQKKLIVAEAFARVKALQQALAGAASTEGILQNSGTSYPEMEFAVDSLLDGTINMTDMAIRALEEYIARRIYVPTLKVSADKDLAGFDFGADALTDFGGSYSGQPYIVVVSTSNLVTIEPQHAGLFKVADVITIADATDSDNDKTVTIDTLIMADDHTNRSNGSKANYGDSVIILDAGDSLDTSPSTDTTATITLYTR